MSYQNKHDEYLSGDLSLDDLLVERKEYLKRHAIKKRIADLTEVSVDGQTYFLELETVDGEIKIDAVIDLKTCKTRPFNVLTVTLQEKLIKALEIDLFSTDEVQSPNELLKDY